MRNPLLFCLAALLLCPFTAQAAIWGYVDAAGETHLADRKVDARYQLFQRDSQLNTDTATVPNAAPVRVNAQRVEPYRKLVAKVAQQYRLDPLLMHAIISVESGYQPAALSAKGAVGLMQVLPETGARFGVSRLSNPKENLKAGARYLKFLLGLFNGDLPLVIAAYNAGEGAVQKYSNRIPPYPETQNYVARVRASYRANGGMAGGGRTEETSRRVHVLIAPESSPQSEL
jgi:soluble lytic murein transglycosylase-like protein